MSNPEDYLVYCRQCGKRGCVCDDMFPKSRAAIREALRELENPCPSCARFAEKRKDREGLGEAIYKASNDFQTDESIRWPNNWKDEWPQYIADAAFRWM